MKTRGSKAAASVPSEPDLPPPTSTKSKRKVLQPSVKQEPDLELPIPPPPIDKPSSSKPSSAGTVAQPGQEDVKPSLLITSSQASSTIQQLSAKNVRLSATVARLSSTGKAYEETIATMDQELRILREEQAVTGMMSKGLANASWEWRRSGNGEEGGWGRFVLDPNSVLASPGFSPLDLPAFLFYLPIQDVDRVTSTLLSFLDTSDLLSLCRVCPKLLEWASEVIYRSKDIRLNSREAALLVKARTSSVDGTHSDEIRHLLFPSKLVLLPKDFLRSDFEILQASPTLPLFLNNLEIHTIGLNDTSLSCWSPLLAHLNPAIVVLGKSSVPLPPPHTVQVRSSDIAFANGWTMLHEVRIVAPARIPIVVGENGQDAFAFRPVMERSHTPRGKRQLLFWMESRYGTNDPEEPYGGLLDPLEIKERDIERWCGPGRALPLALGASHAHFVARLQRDWESELIRAVLEVDF